MPDAPRALVPLDAQAVDRARTAIPSDEMLTVVVEAFQTLGDPTRAHPLCPGHRFTLRSRPRDSHRHLGIWSIPPASRSQRPACG